MPFYTPTSCIRFMLQECVVTDAKHLPFFWRALFQSDHVHGIHVLYLSSFETQRRCVKRHYERYSIVVNFVCKPYRNSALGCKFLRWINYLSIYLSIYLYFQFKWQKWKKVELQLTCWWISCNEQCYWVQVKMSSLSSHPEFKWNHRVYTELYTAWLALWLARFVRKGNVVLS